MWQKRTIVALNRDLRLSKIWLLNLIVSWSTGEAIVLSICGMLPSVFERLELWTLNCFIWMETSKHYQKSWKQGLNLPQLCDFIMQISINIKSFFSSTNILKILYCEKITITEHKIKLQLCSLLLLLFLVCFPLSFFCCNGCAHESQYHLS